MKTIISALLLLSFLSACEQAMMNDTMAADHMADAAMDGGMESMDGGMESMGGT